MNTGESQEGFRKIIDMSRLISIVLLLLHFYYSCYAAFRGWHLSIEFVDRLIGNIGRTGLFKNFHNAKLLSLLFLAISVMGIRGRKDEKTNYKTAFAYVLTGVLLYFLGGLFLFMPASANIVAGCYITTAAIGYILALTGGTQLSKIIRGGLNMNDIFNRENETFPQEERLLENEHSINLPARYRLKNQYRQSWINIVNPYRSTLVCGGPGAGKSVFVIRHVIEQHIRKGFTMFVYDFKFDDLSIIAYNCWLKYKHLYKVAPKIYFIDFDRILHRCNPLDPKGMIDITDATESSRTILLGLNREWLKKTGDFFVESSINFVTAVIWFLRRFQDGEYCTLPHVIELMQVDYNKLFSILRVEKEIEVLINPFINAYKNGAMEQLEGQIASAKIAMARLSSKKLYYVLTGNDFTLDLNNPKEPKIICMGNNPEKIQVYGAVISLYINRMLKMINKKGMEKSSIVIDELATIILSNIDTLIATARSNRVATTLALQDLSQLRKDYGKELADVIMNIAGNIISGQGTGDTAKQLSEAIGKIMQLRQSMSINSSDTSISKSMQLDYAVPASRIANLSAGEVVGRVADNPDCRIEQKVFHCEIQNDFDAIKREEAAYKPIPEVRKLDDAMIQRNYLQVKQDVQDIVAAVLERMISDPALQSLIVKK